MERENAAAFARRLGVNRSTVSRALADGRLIAVDGWLDIALNLQRWQDTKTGARPDVSARHAAKRGAGGPNPSMEAETAPQREITALLGDLLVEDSPEAGSAEDRDSQALDATAPHTLQHYAALKLAAQNDLVRLGMALRAHRRYPLEKIRKEAQSLGGTLRSALERLIDQTAPRLAMLPGPERVALLAEEAAKLRRLLRREPLRALRRIRQN